MHNILADVGFVCNRHLLNRIPPNPDLRFPGVPGFTPDKITLEVKRIAEREFPDHFGSCDSFYWPVTRSDARVFFQDFLENRLDLFGPYEYGGLFHNPEYGVCYTFKYFINGG
jgi:deoxyribodipyrimidine photolyase-related protein